MVNSRPCSVCGPNYEDRSRTGYTDEKGKKHRGNESEPEEPGMYTQHENIKSAIGTLAVFECSRCKNVLFFRASYETEEDLLG